MTPANDEREPRTFRVVFTETNVYGIEVEAEDREQAYAMAHRARRDYGCDPQVGFVELRDDHSSYVEEVTDDAAPAPCTAWAAFIDFFRRRFA